MQQRSRLQGLGAKALAIVLSFVLVAGSPTGLLPEQLAFAEDADQTVQPKDDTSAEETADNHQEKIEAPAHINEEVPLAVEEASEAPAVSEGDETAEAPAVGVPAKAEAEVALVNESPKPATGTLVFDGLEYELNQDGSTVTLVGFHGAAPKGELVIPSKIKSGEDEYLVTRLEFRGGVRIFPRLN